MWKTGRLCLLTTCTTGAAFVLVSCGGGSSGEPVSDVCKVSAALSSAVQQINQTPLSKGSTAAIEASLHTVDTALTNLDKVDSTEFQKEIDAVKTSGDTLDKTVNAALDSPTQVNNAAGRASMASFTTQVDNFATATNDSC
jgi:hypothetical protein